MLLPRETVVDAEVECESSRGKQKLCLTPKFDAIEIDRRNIIPIAQTQKNMRSHSHIKKLTKAESHLIPRVALPDAICVSLSITELKFVLTKAKSQS